MYLLEQASQCLPMGRVRVVCTGLGLGLLGALVASVVQREHSRQQRRNDERKYQHAQCTHEQLALHAATCVCELSVASLRTGLLGLLRARVSA
jgi:hypothetical protein